MRGLGTVSFHSPLIYLLQVPLRSVQGGLGVSLPDILTGCPAELLDGSTLLLVFVPACSLAGAVAVVSKLTLGTAVQIGLVPETAVAHLSGQTGKEPHTQNRGTSLLHHKHVSLISQKLQILKIDNKTTKRQKTYSQFNWL